MAPPVAVRLDRPVTDEQRSKWPRLIQGRAEAIAFKETRFEYALPDADKIASEELGKLRKAYSLAGPFKESAR